MILLLEGHAVVKKHFKVSLSATTTIYKQVQLLHRFGLSKMCDTIKKQPL